MSRIDKWLSGVLISIITVMITLTMIEVAANYYLWNIASNEAFNLFASVNQFHERYDVSTEVRFIPHHYLPYVLNPLYKQNGNRHNALGFRGEETTVAKPEGVYRILAIGGSTTYGSGVSRYDKSYPYRLEQYLHAQGYTNIEVINAGVPGATSYESLLNLQFRVLEVDPDLIIIYHATNDAHARLIAPPSAYRADNSGYRAPVTSNVFMPSIFEYSTFLRIIGIQLGIIDTHNSLEKIQARYAETSVTDAFFDLWESSIATNAFDEFSVMELIEANPPIYFEQNLKSMIGIANIHDIDVMLTTWAYSPDFISEARSASDEYILMYQQHNDLIRSIAKETDVYFYDFVLDMPTDAKYFTDGRHMSQNGNERRGKLFGDFIIKNILANEDNN